MDLVKVSGIRKQEGDRVILEGISLVQKEFRRIALAGESGAGKTTLLKSIGGLVQPDAGEILYKGERVKGPLERLIPGHPGIAYLSQHFELRNNYRVEDLLQITNNLPEAEAAAIYELCRIRHLLQRKTDQVSGGERQRIGLARLLISSPGLLLLDEPFSNLDPIHKALLKEVIGDVGEKLKISCLLASHDPLDTLSWAEEIIVLKEGRIVQKGPPEEIYGRPVSEYVGALFGSYNLIRPEDLKQFIHLPGVAMNGNPLFIRPGNIKLTKRKGQENIAGEQALKGIVDRLLFFGNYYEAEVTAGGCRIRASVGDRSIHAGDIVYVSWPADAPWYGLNR